MYDTLSEGKTNNTGPEVYNTVASYCYSSRFGPNAYSLYKVLFLYSFLDRGGFVPI